MDLLKRFFVFLGPTRTIIFLILVPTLASIFILIATGKIALKEIAFNAGGVKALINGTDSPNWKPLLAELVEASEAEWINEVGLFLFLNGNIRMGGRDKFNFGEICYAVQYAHHTWKENQPYCNETAFAQTKMAVDSLDALGFLERVRYAKDNRTSFGLNALGTKAFEQLRSDYSHASTQKVSLLARLDLNYPEISANLLNARNWYSSSLPSQ